MKIAIFSDNFYPEFGGIADSITALSKELGARGHKIRIYAPRYPKSAFEISNLPLDEVDLGSNVTVKRLFSFPFHVLNKQSRMVIPLGLSFKDLKEFSPDVIHTHLFYGVGIEALVASRLFKIPILATNHTALEEFSSAMPWGFLGLSKLLFPYAIFYFNRCRIVTTPSANLLNEMVASGFKNGGAICSNPVDTKIFSPIKTAERESLRKKYRVSRFAIIYAGRFAPEKELPILIKAFVTTSKKFGQVSLLLAGNGPEEQRLKKLAEESGMTDKIHFVGTLKSGELSELFNVGDIFALSSPAESQNMSLMQAMATGLSSVCVKSKGVADYLSPSEGILVPIGDLKAMSEAFELLLNNEAVRKRMGENAKIKARKYSVELSVSEYENYYKKILETAE